MSSRRRPDPLCALLIRGNVDPGLRRDDKVGNQGTLRSMGRLIPANLDELRDAVAGALAAEEPVEIVGGGSKRGFGRPLQTPHVLDLSRLSGIRDYAPSELVLTAGAATPLA